MTEQTNEIHKYTALTGVTVQAQLMTHGAYNEFRGWEVPADENATDAGYLVQQSNGDTAHVSWYPSEIFEALYGVSDTPKQRVGLELIARKAELDALEQFILQDQPDFIDNNHWQYLHTQAPILRELVNVLTVRHLNM